MPKGGHHKARRRDRDRRRNGRVVRLSEAHGDPQTDLPKACRRKAAYATRNLARDQARRVSKERGEDLDFYACREGGRRHWHIGHPRPWEKPR